MTIKSILTFVVGIALCQASGCALLARPSVSSYGAISSYDGVSTAYSGESLARQTVEELSRRYPPGRTSIILVKAPGSFGENLETSLRQQGFAVVLADATNSAAGVTLGYQFDEVVGENTCYLQVSASDGVRFGFVKSLTELAQTELPVPPAFNLSTTSVEVSPLPSLPESSEPPALPVPALMSPGKPVAGTRLAHGVLSSLPPNWRYTIPESSRRSVQVSKPRLPWREAIQNMAEQAGCAASFDESARRVTLIAYDDAPVPAKQSAVTPVPAKQSAVTPAASTSVASLSLPAPRLATAALSPSPVQSSTSAATSSTPLAVTSALEDVSELPPLMAEPDSITVLESAPSAEQWDVMPGSLFAQLSGWYDRAGYQLVWKASHDLDMEAHANFRGSFTEFLW